MMEKDMQTEGANSEVGQALEAPTHWPSDDRELFTKQPKDVQAMDDGPHQAPMTPITPARLKR